MDPAPGAPQGAREAKGAAEFEVGALPELRTFPGDPFASNVLPSSKALAGDAEACADLRDCDVPELPTFLETGADVVMGLLGAKLPLFPRGGAVALIVW